MRFVPIKSEAQQGALQRARALLDGQRTALICALRGYLAEFGIVEPKGPRNIAPQLTLLGKLR